MKHIIFFTIISLVTGMSECDSGSTPMDSMVGEWNVTEYVATSDSLTLNLLDVEDASSSMRFTFSSDSFQINYVVAYPGEPAFTYPFAGTWAKAGSKLDLSYTGDNSLSAFLTGDDSKVETYNILNVSKSRISLSGENSGINSAVTIER